MESDAQAVVPSPQMAGLRACRVPSAMMAMARRIASMLSQSQAAEAVPVEALPTLPFDHPQIVEKAIERLRGKATYSSLPAFLLPSEFTMNDLHHIYQQTIGTRLDQASFRHKILEQDIIEPMPNRFRPSCIG